jgi:hypothetical protein
MEHLFRLLFGFLITFARKPNRMPSDVILPYFPSFRSNLTREACGFAIFGHAGALPIFVTAALGLFHPDRFPSLRFAIRSKIYINL